MLGSQAVGRGQHDGPRLTGKLAADLVMGLQGAQDPPSAMEVDEHRQDAPRSRVVDASDERTGGAGNLDVPHGRHRQWCHGEHAGPRLVRPRGPASRPGCATGRCRRHGLAR